MQMNRLLAPLPPTPIPTSLLVPKLHQLPLTSSVRQHPQPNETARGGEEGTLKGPVVQGLLGFRRKEKRSGILEIRATRITGETFRRTA